MDLGAVNLSYIVWRHTIILYDRNIIGLGMYLRQYSPMRGEFDYNIGIGLYYVSLRNV